jgi:hypothetical protein
MVFHEHPLPAEDDAPASPKPPTRPAPREEASSRRLQLELLEERTAPTVVWGN